MKVKILKLPSRDLHQVGIGPPRKPQHPYQLSQTAQGPEQSLFCVGLLAAQALGSADGRRNAWVQKRTALAVLGGLEWMAQQMTHGRRTGAEILHPPWGSHQCRGYHDHQRLQLHYTHIIIIRARTAIVVHRISGGGGSGLSSRFKLSSSPLKRFCRTRRPSAQAPHS